jgi:hypothetical protein
MRPPLDAVDPDTRGHQRELLAMRGESPLRPRATTDAKTNNAAQQESVDAAGDTAGRSG